MKTSLLLLICKVTLNGPPPCVPSPSQNCGGGDILYSWTPQVWDPITNPPFGGPWLHPFTKRQARIWPYQTNQSL